MTLELWVHQHPKRLFVRILILLVLDICPNPKTMIRSSHIFEIGTSQFSQLFVRR